MKKSENFIKFKNKNLSRVCALEILLQISSSNFAQKILDTTFKKNILTGRDKALTTELVYGSLRFYIRSEYILSLFLPDLKKLPRVLIMTLRMAVYELLFLDRIPHYATVDFSVEFIKFQFGKKLAGLANAVLHKILKLEKDVFLIEFYKKKNYFFSVLPWMYGYFINSYGEQVTHTLLSNYLQRPIMSLRLNRKYSEFHKLSLLLQDNDNAKSIENSISGFQIFNGLTQIDGTSLQQLHDDGAFSWQATGSQIVIKKCLENLPQIVNNPLWDACAGQGGKTMALLENDVDVFFASDINFERLLLLKKNSQRLGVKLPNIICSELTHLLIKPDFLKNSNSTILLDVPCSGFGTMAKRPEIRLYRSYEDVQTLINLQRKILFGAFDVLRVGQAIIYMTCTLNPHENERQIELLLNTKKTAECLYSWQTPYDVLSVEGMYVAIILKK